MSQGSVEEFKANWQRPEAEYCHFTRGEPENQIQFAFRQNWLEFRKILSTAGVLGYGKCLEVGAGRGTMSMYMSQAGFDCNLLDMSERSLYLARKNFEANTLPVSLTVGDANQLPFEDCTFNAVFSYGLLEHFDNILRPLQEQTRVTRNGGVVIAYVVAHKANHHDRLARIVNRLLAHYAHAESEKDGIHLNGYEAGIYEAAIVQCGLTREDTRHVYSVPILSPSPEFPFTLNPSELERELVECFDAKVKADGGWNVPECDSQAFIVWGRKP